MNREDNTDIVIELGQVSLPTSCVWLGHVLWA